MFITVLMGLMISQYISSSKSACGWRGQDGGSLVSGPLGSRVPLLAVAVSASSAVLDFSVELEVHLEQLVSGPDGAEQLFKDRAEVTLSWSEGWTYKTISLRLLL